jgi:uncharacterized RDD family membrane protein YckC
MSDEAIPRTTEAIQAGFSRRWTARFLDQLFLAVISVALLLIFRANTASYPSSDAVQRTERFLELSYLLVAGLYFALTEGSAMQASPGKRLLGIKVVDSNGNQISFFLALGRWCAAGLSWLSLGIGFLMAAVGRRRALHDLISRTQVVDRWAFSATPERQRTPTFGHRASAFASLTLVLLVIVGSSQYSDYVLRSQVSEGQSLADSIQRSMESYAQIHGAWPTSTAQIRFGKVSGSYVQAVDVGSLPGRIKITYSSKPPQRASSKLDGRRLFIDGRLQDGEVRWICHSPELRQHDCPSSCRCSW